ncbi:MAG: hypothetical protein P1V81_07600 [Planctomycetota bacterium]|nr:hypothetical protein [Planctomycetota bacterium]
MQNNTLSISPMLPIGLTLALGLGLASAIQPEDEVLLQPRYEAGSRVQLASEFVYESEVTNFEMIRDGEPVDMGDRMMGGPSALSRWVTLTEHVAEVEDGAPSVVRRAFERLESENFRIRRDEEVVDSSNGPLEGVTLELTREDGDVVAEVVEGSSPDDDALLEGFSMDLGLAALLPTEAVEPGATWEPEAGALLRALGMDVEQNLFPRVTPGATEGGRGGGRGGARGGGGGGAPIGDLFRDGEWELEATLASEQEDYDGQACYVIELTGSGETDIPDRERPQGGGRPGGGDAPLAFVQPELSLLAGTATMELEGKLYFSAEEGRVVHLDVTCEVVIESETSRESERGSMQTSSTTEGSLTLKVDVTEVAEEE